MTGYYYLDSSKKHSVVWKDHLTKATAKKAHNAAPLDILIKKAMTVSMYHLLGHFVYRL